MLQRPDVVAVPGVELSQVVVNLGEIPPRRKGFLVLEPGLGGPGLGGQHPGAIIEAPGADDIGAVGGLHPDRIAEGLGLSAGEGEPADPQEQFRGVHVGDHPSVISGGRQAAGDGHPVAAAV